MSASLQIRKALSGDLKRIMSIYRVAQEFMIRSGNPTQWGHFYPTADLIRDDICAGISFVLCNGEVIHGVFALVDGIEPTYEVIEGGRWLNDEPYLTVHRVASDGEVHGVFRCIADHCKTMTSNIRIDTHADNALMQRLIEKSGFVKCGMVYVKNGTPRIAYQWTASLDEAQRQDAGII